MQRIHMLLRYRDVVFIVFLAALAVGGYGFSSWISRPTRSLAAHGRIHHPEPLLVGGRNGAAGHPSSGNGTERHARLDQIRSISIFGLSDVKMYFDFDSDFFVDRQEALNRLQSVTLPDNLRAPRFRRIKVGEKSIATSSPAPATR